MWPGLAAAQEPPAPPQPPPAQPQPQPPQPQFEPPELLQFVQAEYPPAAQAAGLAATVTLEILVDVTGASADVKVVTPVGDGFDEAAIAAARQFRWKPARSGGKDVPVRVRYEYHFELEPVVEPPPDTPPDAQAGTAVLRGTIVQRGTRVPLAGAEVIATRAGEGAPAAQAEADAKGAFEIRELPAGKYRVTVAAIGHARRVFDETLADRETVEVRYYLSAEGDDPYQTVVEGERPRDEIQRHSATRDQATRIAGTRGDALRVVENFPGVARPPLGIGALIVRGSNPEDTASYIAGHWIPIIYHFGGITSIVNADLLERIDFLPGNFSARYGRATGGLVAVELRAPRRDRLHGYIDASLLDTGILFEGPIGKGSWAVAARRSYVDAVLNLVLPEDAGFSFFTAPRYWDYQAILDYPVGGGRLNLTAFGSSDKFSLVLADPADADPGFRGSLGQTTYIQRLHVSWKKTLSPRTSVHLSAAQGFTQFVVAFGEFLKIDLAAWFGSYRAEVVHRPFRRVKVTFGTEGQFYPFEIDVRGPPRPVEGDVFMPPSSQEQREQHRSDYEWRSGTYLEAEIDAGHGVTVTPGTRIDYYRLNNAFAADPRITARWTRDADSVRAGVGRFSQPPLESDTDPVFGDPDLRPYHALHFSVGYDRRIFAPLRAESTLFYKHLTDLVVRDDTTILRGDGTIGPANFSNRGSGRVYGAELLVRYNRSREVFGWVSYTLSRSERRNAPGEDLRLFSLDQTHILTIVGNLRLPWRMLAGFRFRFVSGNPDTPLIGSIYDADSDTYVPIPGALNSERLDAWHQLDVRIEKRFTFDSWRMTAYVDVQNAYNQANPEFYSYSYDFRQRTIVPSLPIFPSFGVKGEF